MNRIHLWGFRGLGGLYRTVVQHREGDVDVKPTVGSGAAARNAAPHQNPSLQTHEAKGWGSKNDPRNKKNAKNRTA